MKKLLFALVLALLPTTALAHPLGNFTVNRYARIEASARAVALHYVIDMAEIPTFQELPGFDPDRRAEELRRGLTLSVDGAPLALRTVGAKMALTPGQGGLQTLRLEVDYAADAGAGALYFRDDNFAGRVGWREVLVRAGEGVAVQASTVPATDASDELRRYPDDLLATPLDVREARATVVLGTSPSSAVLALVGSASRLATEGSLGAARSPAGTAAAAAADRGVVSRLPTGDPLVAFGSLADMVAAGRLGGGAIALALALAALWGAAHALSPGHGKTIVAAYLVGSRGTARHALYLGLTVTATHTLGIYALGLVTLFAARFVLPELLYPWLSLASGVAVVGVGASLLARRLRGREHGHSHGEHDHAHADHIHDVARAIADHGHDHAHEAAHSHAHHDHAPPERVTPRSLLALGIAGGILPCPSALVLLLGAIAIGQVAFGLVLVAAFSAGLAFVLTGIGVALVYAKRVVSVGQPRLLRLAPAASALVVTLLGLAMTLEALRRVAA